MNVLRRAIGLARTRTVANAAAAFIVAAFCAVWLGGYVPFFDRAHYGDFGFSIDDSSWVVTDVVPHSPAAVAGVKPGDHIDRAVPWRSRLILTTWVEPHPGESMTLRLTRDSQQRLLTMRARALPRLAAIESAVLAASIVGLLIFVSVGVALVLLRPSRMTWGFYLFSYVAVVSLSQPAPGLPANWYAPFDFASDLLVVSGVIGFLIFCLRFPTNAPTGWRRSIDTFCPYLFVPFLGLLVPTDVSRFFDFPPPYVEQTLWHLWLAACLVMFAVGTAVLVAQYAGSRGPARYRLKWVIVGLLCTFGGSLFTVVSFWLWWSSAGPSAITSNALGILWVGLPLTVAYAVIRHRVIDIRFVVSRALVLGVIASMTAFVVIGVDWLVSAKVPLSRTDVAIIAGAAIVMGFLLNMMRQWISRAIDFLFFRDWLRAQINAEAIRDALHTVTAVEDLRSPLTSGVARAFSLASAALFERVEDGGFVRVAAEGWPPGSFWHILLDDPLAARASERRCAVDLESFQWTELHLPTGVARPTLMLPIAAGRKVPALLLLGSHETGASIDPDEIRSIHTLLTEAALVYEKSSAARWEQRTFIAQPSGA